jgi:hypothetical protein
MLAVRHDVAVSALKRLNNITSEHSLASRSTVYIPGAHTQHSTHTTGLAATHTYLLGLLHTVHATALRRQAAHLRAVSALLILLLLLLLLPKSAQLQLLQSW